MPNAWWKKEKKSARKQRALAVLDYALARGRIDQATYAEFRRLVPQTPHEDVPGLVGDLPVPRWDLVALTEPVDRPQRDFAVALLDVACQAEALTPAERKWRAVFAANARIAADLTALFLDLEPHLHRRRQDPAMVERLERLAFVPEIFRARSQGGLSRAELTSFLERAASGESLDTLRAELVGKTPVKRPADMRPRLAEVQPRTADRPPKRRGERTRREPAAEAAPVVAADPPVSDLDRARIAKYLERALHEERLDPGEHAVRTLALWSATTTGELAKLVVDLPVPVDEPLRDRKPNPHADDLITPAHRQAVLDRLDRAMAGHVLTLWEYETRLDVALKARSFQELGPATADLPAGW